MFSSFIPLLYLKKIVIFINNLPDTHPVFFCFIAFFIFPIFAICRLLRFYIDL